MFSESIDGRTQIKSTSQLKQVFPHIGFVWEAATYQPNSGTLITHVTNTLATLVTDGTAANGRVFPYVSQSIQETHEVDVGGTTNGQQIARVTQTTTLGSYGDAPCVRRVR